MSCYRANVQKVHDKSVGVKLTCVFLFLEIQSPKRHLNWYITLVLCQTLTEGHELLLITKLEVLDLL